MPHRGPVLIMPGQNVPDLTKKDHSMGYRMMQIIASILKSRLSRRSEQFLKAIKNHPDILQLFQQK